MSNVGNKYKIGVFVVISMAILVLSLATLGIMNTFEPKYLFMTAIDRSVQGLEVGAKVKIKGVTIGKVTEIQIGEYGKVVYIYMNFIAPSFKSVEEKRGPMTHAQKYEYFKGFLREQVKKGLRCQLHYSGITGSLYQELKVTNRGNNYKKFKLPKNHPIYVPSVEPVLMGDILKNLNKTLETTAQLNLQPMIAKIEKLATTGSKFIESEDLKKMLSDLRSVIKHLDSITKSVQTEIDNGNFAKMMKESNKAITELNKTLIKSQKFINTIEAEVKSMQLKATTADARKLMGTSDSTVKELRATLKNNLANLNQTIHSANSTLKAAKRLLNTLNQNPSFIIYGKDKKKVIEP